LPDTASLIQSSESSDQTHLLLPEPSPAIQLTPLFGSAPSEHQQTLYALYVSQIATIIWRHESQRGLESCRRSVVVGLALSKFDSQGEMQAERETFEGVMNMLHDLLRQE
jgi:proteasome assembly chaperone 3